MNSPEHQGFPRQSVPGNTHVYRDGGMNVDVYKFIDLTKDVPVQAVDLSTLQGALDDHCWSDANGRSIGPREILASIQISGGIEAAIKAHPEFAEHIRKIDSADTSFPIHMHQGKVVDGMHRLTKAALDGATIIHVKRVEEIPKESILPPGFDKED